MVKPFSARRWNLLRAGFLAGLAVLLCGPPAGAATWRVGDQDQPWQLYPVSFLLDGGEVYAPDYQWGGAKSMEVVVDDDGDGLVDEDPVDIVDNDGDGLWNEDMGGMDLDKDGNVDDQVDPQIDNDGDGMVNEDGRRTGGMIYELQLRQAYTQAPFFRPAAAAEAAAAPQGPGYGWGDDDHDTRFNEDPQDGADNDGDGLVDEDSAGPATGVPQGWQQPVFAYGGEGLTAAERRGLRFAWDGARRVYVAARPAGQEVVARLGQQRFRPRDWIRPIRADSTRNLLLVLEDRFLSGCLGVTDPVATLWWGWQWTGTTHEGESGHGQVVDGNIFTARVTSQSSTSAGFRADFRGLFYVDLIRLRPRPDFPDRTPTSFAIYYIGDKPSQFQTRYTLGELITYLVWNELLIPIQRDLERPAVKEYRFEVGGEFGPPPKVRIFHLGSWMPEGQTWELAEFEVYGHGYSLDASYMSEIIDVGPARPRARRYFDPQDRSRPIAFESVLTQDDNRNDRIDREELAASELNAQFDTAAVGQAVTWGQVRWQGKMEGKGGNALVRVRAGSSLDPSIYQRKVGRGVYSPFIETPIELDWPARGTRIDAFSYVALSPVERASFETLPYNTLSDRDGMVGGWTPWSAPFNFEDGQADEQGGEGYGCRCRL